MTLTRAVLCLGAAMRLTRFIVADDVPGQWWIKDPIDKAIDAWWVRERTVLEESMPVATITVGDDEPVRYGLEPTPPWWFRYRDGLDCPFCVGQWVAFAVVAVELLTARRPTSRVRGAWTALAAGLTLNETAAHLGARLGDTASDPDE